MADIGFLVHKYTRPGLIFFTKVSIKRPDLSQVLRASVHENQGFSIFFEKVFIKRQFQIPENQFSYKSNKNTSLFSFESVFEVHY